LSAFIEGVTGSQVGATERSIRLGLSIIIREEQLGSLLGVEE
jgi:hypothetical protein